VTSFVGRAREQIEVLSLLEHGRLVTLTGAGGAGKTRLLLQVAARSVETYPDGVWLVELATLADQALVPQAVAAALGAREEPGQRLRATLAAALQPRTVLLLLDNCEHLLAGCAAVVSGLLRACPNVRILASSREGMGVAGETIYRVPSLALPDLDRLPDPEQLSEYEAVQLFLDRARARRPAFCLTDRNAHAVAQVCAHLDGMPLAIELAAVRVDSLAVEAIAARLDDRFRLLTGGARDALPRQRTLRAALDWSYDLLREAEQLLLDRLAVFAGGCTLPAAEVVGAGQGIEDWEVLDLLGSLVNKSLVQTDERVAGELRYGLLETVRQYGQERLSARGGVAAVRDRHLALYLLLAEETEPQLTGPEQVTWLDRLETEHDNLRAALAWARDQRRAEEGLRLAGALWRFWDMRGYFDEGRTWLEAALASGEGGAPAVRARALNGAGYLSYLQGDFEHATALHEAALTLARGIGDKQIIASSLNYLGRVVETQGEYGRATALLDEALALAREVGDTQVIATSLTCLGWMAQCQGEYERAADLHRESLVLYRQMGDKAGIAWALDCAGGIARQRGEFGRSLQTAYFRG
jgi:non-specific serine/threonine protein kinase